MGRVEASLLRLLPTDAAGGEILMSTGTARISGSLLDLSGIEVHTALGSLSANPHALFRTAVVDPAQLVVLISPLRRSTPPGRS